MTHTLTPTAEIISDLRAGKMIILVDDENRENEGDLVIPAAIASADQINFMATYGRGLICLALSDENIKRLDLGPMSQSNDCRLGTAFTVSIDAKEGITTGISAFDRALTVQLAADPTSRRQDLAVPGHIFPLHARTGGVLERAGHTEASVELARLSGYTHAAVICEIMKDDGTMARLPDLIEFAQQHDLRIGSIHDLITYVRAEKEAA